MTRVLIIGSQGQVGCDLYPALVKEYGADAVVLSDILPQHTVCGCFEWLDVLDREKLDSVLERHRITDVYMLAAMLSAAGERTPYRAWTLNMGGLLNVLDAAKSRGLKVFWPSSIAVFGNSALKRSTPQVSPLDPSTVYGISKLAGELWCSWYRSNHGVDIRSLRYPGLISHSTKPSGGTTDFAVDIFHAALGGQLYCCYLHQDTCLPFMYMADAVRATIELMRESRKNLQQLGSYNIAGMSFTPKELEESICRHFPDFRVSYQPDFRQDIAASWPETINDDCARSEWGWQPKYDLKSMVSDMVDCMRKVNSMVLCESLA